MTAENTPPQPEHSQPITVAKPSEQTNRRTKAILWVAVLVIIALIIGLMKLIKYQGEQQKAAQSADAKPQPALSVSVVNPQTLNWEQSLSTNGTVAAWQEAVIGSEISGLRLTHVHVNVGDIVKKGQVLAEINPDTIQADLAQSKAQAAEAKAVLAEAAANAKRIQGLKNTGAMSSQEAAQYQTNQQTAQARLDAALAKVDADELRLSQTWVVAPDNGIISARTATVGSLAQTGQELFRLIRDQRLEWRAEVTSSELYQLKQGMAVKVFSPNPQRTAVMGTIRMISPVINPETSYGLVYVDLPASSAIRMGMYAKGEFLLGSKPAVTVPQGAVLLRDGFAYVFIVDNKNRVSQQKVTLGRRVGDRIEVPALKDQVRVAASGTSFLSDGDLVTVAKATEASPLVKQLTANQGGQE